MRWDSYTREHRSYVLYDTNASWKSRDHFWVYYLLSLAE